jgi:hypothetical protein
VREIKGYLAAGAAADDRRRGRRQRVKKRGCVIDMVTQIDGLERFGTLAAEKPRPVVDDAPAEVG